MTFLPSWEMAIAMTGLEWPVKALWIAIVVVCHSLMVLSEDPETICLLSGVIATVYTQSEWPIKVFWRLDVVVSHSLTVLSKDPDTLMVFEERLIMARGYNARNNLGKNDWYIITQAVWRYPRSRHRPLDQQPEKPTITLTRLSIPT